MIDCCFAFHEESRLLVIRSGPGVDVIVLLRVHREEDCPSSCILFLGLLTR